jgi:ADP-heptose:LPS heptosyltransferase
MSQIPLPTNASVCIISARRYGDAIINANFLRAAANARPDIRWTIWTKPEFAPLFELVGFTNIISSEFPIAGGVPKTVREGGLSLIKAIYQLRNMHLDASIDFIGDSREALLGCLITDSKHHSPKWSNSHWMHKLIWNYQIPFINYINIASTQDQIYKVIPSLLSTLTGKAIDLASSTPSIQQPPKIAFHPFSSQAFKSWPKKYWQELSKLMLDNQLIPVIFCMPSEKSLAQAIFSEMHPQVSILATESLNHLINEMKTIDLLVGVDSFLVHLASTLNKKTIVINSGNLPSWWQAPNSIPLGQSGGCAAYPCANQPTCLGKTSESQCIKSIEPKKVMAEITEALPQVSLS